MDAGKVQLGIERINSEARLPFYAHEGDAGMDVCAAEHCILAPGETRPIRTGLKLAIPRGYEIQVRPRSGLSLKTPLRLPNSPGTIDSGYKDELMILMQNTSRADEGHYTVEDKGNCQGRYEIRPGDRIAQLVMAPVVQAELLQIDSAQAASISETSNRGGGFGHSGMRHED